MESARWIMKYKFKILVFYLESDETANYFSRLKKSKTSCTGIKMFFKKIKEKTVCKLWHGGLHNITSCLTTTWPTPHMYIYICMLVCLCALCTHVHMHNLYVCGSLCVSSCMCALWMYILYWPRPKVLVSYRSSRVRKVNPALSLPCTQYTTFTADVFGVPAQLTRCTILSHLSSPHAAKFLLCNVPAQHNSQFS